MKTKKRCLIVVLIISLMMWSCENNETNNETNQNIIESTEAEATVDSNEETKVVLETIEHRFISGEEAVVILAADDDYTTKLSLFDYASKYQSEVVLDVAGRAEILASHVLEWSNLQKEIIDEAMANIVPKVIALGIDMPDIQFILATPEDEGGAAGYTRDHAIILKTSILHAGEGLEKIITHEMFHVYSRAHRALRPSMYAVISYLPCEELVVPDELKDLTIGNPDAPDNNFYIEGLYKGEVTEFIPLIYSSAPYDLNKGGSFFSTLKDDMLAVEIIEGIPQPIYENGWPLIVEKEDITDYFDKIGQNTYYTFHPEETMADNFVFLIFETDVPSPFVVEGLRKVICTK